MYLIQCDRCLATEEADEHQVPSGWKTVKEVDTIGTVVETIHFCNDCVDDFRSWLSEEQ
jgi:hypothetical protein